MNAAATNEVQTAVRLPADLVARVDALVKSAEGWPEFAVSRATRSSMLRLAILRGLEVLEEGDGRQRRK